MADIINNPNSPGDITPESLAALIRGTLTGPMSASGIPPMIARPDATPPQASPDASMFDPAALAAKISQIPAMASALGRQTNVADQEQAIKDRMGAIPLPKTAPSNPIVRALAGLTPPGRAVTEAIYAPGITSYNQQQKVLADQLAALTKQAEIPAEQERGLTGALSSASLGAYRGGELQNRETANKIAQQNANQRGQAIANNYTIQLQKIEQGSKKLSIDQQNLALRQWFDKGLLEAMNARVAAGMSENDARIAAQEDMRGALSQNQWALQHPIWNAIGLSPTITAAPGAQTAPVSTPKQTAPKGGGKHGTYNPATGQVEWH